MKSNHVLNPAIAEPLLALFSLAILVAAFFIAPKFGGTALVVGCSAILLAAQVLMFPDRFRSRSGSLTAAICLVVGMAVAAAAIAVLSLIQGHWG